MVVKELELQGFRNIEKLFFEPSPELTVISGKNGQGKTNLLESVWLLTGSKSFRASKDAELIKKGEPFAILQGRCNNDTKESNIRITISNNETDKKGRYAKINGVDFSRATNIAGVFTAVVFAPSHLSLVKGSPEGRRRFVDAALCQLYPAYISTLRKYNRFLIQKNALLKQKENKKDLLSIYNDGIAEYGEEIQKKRRQYIEEINLISKEIYADISKNSEALLITYAKSFEQGELRETLEKNSTRENAAGYCLTGPHREDFNIELSKTDAKAYASQGQQRSCVLALKLAEAMYAKDITGEHPVMLLDDVLSELDAERQEYLLTGIKGKQTIVTSCDESAFIKTRGCIYEMNGGQLQKRRD